MSTLVGTELDGRYRLDALIGAGGMSTVYRAVDTTLERDVAIKLMHREIATDSDQLERFRREARAVAQLSHPHIVGVIDAGEDEGRPYIVLEYVRGETLKDRIRRCGRLPIDESLAYAVEIARALGAAHAALIVHRDVKPQNVLIDPEGSAKVTDFGIARSLEEEGLTADGRVLGTTDYVSPEQALGHAVTGQSDLYSLGIVLYEMLTGETPFQADTQVAVAMKHVREPLPDVQRRRPEISAALASVVEHATAKETQNRYQSVGQMVHDLEEVLAIEAARSGQTTGEATTVLQSLSGDTADFLPIRLRRPKRALAFTLLVLALLAATAVFLATRTEKGTGGTVVKKPPELSEVQLAGGAAHDYDPAGDGHESEDAARYAIDGNRSTNWNTERYEGGFAGNNNKPGVGIYVDVGKPIAARGLALVTATPHFKARVYASESVPSSIAGWVAVSPVQEVQQDHTFRLRTKGRKFRNYLLWITELPVQNKAQIQELGLLK